MVKTVLLVLHVIVCLSLILIVILQSGRSAGISGEIAGGAETFFGKNKARTLNGDGALSQALSEINNLSSRTSVAEQINNVVDNAKYAFGSSIAANKIAYITYKTSNLILCAKCINRDLHL